MNSLTRESLLAATGHTIVTVKVPEWGGTVCVRTLTAGELLALTSTDGETSGPSALVRLLAACLCDVDGKRLLTDADAEALAVKPAPVLYRIYREACRINGLDAVEQREKN